MDISEFVSICLYLQASADELSDLSCDEKTTKRHNNLDDPTNLVWFALHSLHVYVHH